jgi:energy-coupling factor transporter ATP-binding protein EcfA2
MRIIRLRLADFLPRRELAVEFGNQQDSSMNMAFLVGPNGSGKSRVLEALGRIFSHLDAGLPVGMDFELEYELGPRRILVTTRQPLAEIAEPPARIEQIDAWVLVDEQNIGRWRPSHAWDEWSFGSLERLLPAQVIGLSSGPASRLDWALRGAVADSLAQRRESEAQRPVGGIPASEWRSYSEEEKREAEREQRLAGARSRCVALSGQELALAVLTILCHPSKLKGGTRIRNDLLRRVGLTRKSLLAFTFEVSAQGREQLLPKSRDKFDELLEHSVRRVALAADHDPSGEEEAERDERVVFEVTSEFQDWVAKSADTPFVWFLQLLRWLKAGALRTVRMVLRKSRDKDLFLASDFSDGEFLLLGRYGLLLLLREHDECLILFDEPETHFNDQWKVNLVYDLVRIFKSTSAQVVIATHSDITLSDADREAVRVFDSPEAMKGQVLTVRKPPISPLGAERSGISASVFEAEPAIGKYVQEMVIEPSLRRRKPKEIRAAIDRVGPGYQQFRLRQALREVENDAD